MRPTTALGLGATLLGLTACGGTAIRSVPVDLGDGPVALEGFAPCSDAPSSRVDLTSEEPLVVIVHGCFASGAQFRTMSQLFEHNGQRTVCFNYDDRHSLRHTARTLRRGLDRIRRSAPDREITVLGHSQGGLISRIALSEVEGASVEGGDVHLVTVSSPFAGIAASEHCGFVWLHILSFGITPGICQAITGHKWTEIPPSARLWQAPRPLHPIVVRHVQILTDEEETCRRFDDAGECAEDDFVFSLREQRNEQLAADDRFRSRTLDAGHAEVTGSDGSVPRALIEALHEEGVLERPAPGRELAFERLMQRIF
ncbi:MAG TPA: alpha/beta fold hydrolase [Sandaracinaceae bacterium LLY-WYZ-13_1]|nr:alpha/beta fold hydrolase [Sandaracinaceae bacterium LLY-WYZ-13_1]